MTRALWIASAIDATSDDLMTTRWAAGDPGEAFQKRPNGGIGKQAALGSLAISVQPLRGVHDLLAEPCVAGVAVISAVPDHGKGDRRQKTGGR
jgi:hypothetical protein